jgi:hypothetical protein
VTFDRFANGRYVSSVRVLELARWRAGIRLRPAYRVTTFVPPDHLDAVLEAVERETPLIFGPYDRSAWWSAVGVEQFRPQGDATPTVGRAGQTERVPTVRLELAVPRDRALLARVLDVALLPHHPWQEPAVFVDECLVTATRMAGDGEGRPRGGRRRLAAQRSARTLR